MKVEIGICTCHRNASLWTTLQSLARVEIPAGTEVKVILADDSLNGSARDLLSRLTTLPFTVVYVPVGRRNIAHARNAVVERADGDVLAFVDDDVEVCSDWLVQGLACLERERADVVFGAVDRLVEGSSSPLAHSFLFRSSDRRTGPVDPSQGSTASCFLRQSFVRRHRLRFEPDFGVTGGEDAYFFALAARLGARIFACQSARAAERFLGRRSSFAWATRRLVRIGGVRAAINARLDTPPPTTYLLKSLLRSVLLLMPSLRQVRSQPGVFMQRYERTFLLLGALVYSVTGFAVHEYHSLEGSEKGRARLKLKRLRRA